MKSKLQQEYDEMGFCIDHGAIDGGLAAETVDHVQWLVKKHPDTRPERLHHQLLVNDPFMHRLVCDDRLVALLVGLTATLDAAVSEGRLDLGEAPGAVLPQAVTSR